MKNEINNIDLNKDKKTINSQNNNLKYKCIFQCPLLYNDIVSAIDLDNNYLVYGTFMGEVALCLIDEFSFMQKNNTNDSNITNANMTLDVDKKEEKNNVKEIEKKKKIEEDLKIEEKIQRQILLEQKELEIKKQNITTK